MAASSWGEIVEAPTPPSADVSQPPSARPAANARPRAARRLGPLAHHTWVAQRNDGSRAPRLGALIIECPQPSVRTPLIPRLAPRRTRPAGAARGKPPRGLTGGPFASARVIPPGTGRGGAT